MRDVLVLGGGFAGLAAVRELSGRRPPGVRVRLIDERADSIFAPLLPDAVSGRVRPEHMRFALRPFCERRGVEFVHAQVQRIDLDGPTAVTSAGEFRADALIICLGCGSNYFGNEEARRRAIGLKTIEEAARIRRAVRQIAAEASEGEGDVRHVVVVGGGYTGFEVASHVAYLLRRVTGRPYRDLRQFCRILIVDVAPQVLGNVSPRVRKWALQTIGRFGIEVRGGCTVDSFLEDGVTLSDGSRLGRAVVAWCAGVTPGPPVAELDVPRTRGGRLEVDDYLRLPGSPNVFAAGDVAGAAPPGQGGPLRMAVQFSLAEGRCAARNALRMLDRRPLHPFRAVDLGYVVPLAPGRAAGVILGWETVGRLPSALHYAMCSIRSWSWANGSGVLLDLVRGGEA